MEKRRYPIVLYHPDPQSLSLHPQETSPKSYYLSSVNLSEQVQDSEEQLRRELIEEHGIHDIVKPGGSSDAPGIFNGTELEGLRDSAERFVDNLLRRQHEEQENNTVTSNR